VQFSVVFDHTVNSEELQAFGQDKAAWESMFLEYVRQTCGMDPAITTVASVTVVGELPTEPTPGIIY
jgi:hypothetical protein